MPPADHRTPRRGTVAFSLLPPPDPVFRFSAPKCVVKMGASTTDADQRDRLAVLDAVGLHLFDPEGKHVESILEQEAKELAGESFNLPRRET